MLLLAPGVVLVDSHGEDREEALLSVAERAAVARAVPARVREYAAGRRCAHEALARLGLPRGAADASLLADDDRVPRWPSGVVGSITHCEGYAGAAVAFAAEHAAIGLDAEPHRPLPDDVVGIVLAPADRIATPPGVCGDRVAFCAKEAAYKAWFPRARRVLEFADVLVDVDGSGAFVADVDGSGRVSGRWEVVGDLVRAAVVVPVSRH